MDVKFSFMYETTSPYRFRHGPELIYELIRSNSCEKNLRRRVIRFISRGSCLSWYLNKKIWYNKRQFKCNFSWKCFRVGTRTVHCTTNFSHARNSEFNHEWIESRMFFAWVISCKESVPGKTTTVVTWIDSTPGKAAWVMSWTYSELSQGDWIRCKWSWVLPESARIPEMDLKCQQVYF